MEKRKKILWCGLGIFMLFMLVMTFWSRVVYVKKLPRVSLQRATSGTVTNTVVVRGSVDAEYLRAVDGLDGVRILEMRVHEGEALKKDTVLYTVDVEEITDKRELLLAQEKDAESSVAGEGGRASQVERAQSHRERMGKIACYEAILAQGGEVHAGVEGMAEEVLMQSGDRMGIGPVLRYAQSDTNRVFSAVISQKDKEFVYAGSEVALTFSKSGEEVRGKIDRIDQEGGVYTATVYLEPGIGMQETEAVMTCEADSQVYDTVVSAEAVYSSAIGLCVYVAEDREGILGTELSVRQIPVQVLAKNESRAAISSQLLEADHEIVVDSTKELHNGAAVMEAE